jgi:hypothetical protein
VADADEPVVPGLLPRDVPAFTGREGELGRLAGLAEGGSVLEVFLRRLGVPAEEIPAEVEERSGLLRQLLASRRVLMLLDNAAAEAQVRPLLPGAGGSLVLVTSRSVLPGLEVDERIGLDVLAEEDAAGLLAGLIGADHTPAQVPRCQRRSHDEGTLHRGLREHSDTA